MGIRNAQAAMFQTADANMRIIVADDHPAVAIGISSVLQGANSAVVTPVTTPTDLLHLLRGAGADLVVCDLNMPGPGHVDGFRLVEQLRRHQPAVPIIVLTMIRIAPVLRTLIGMGIGGLVHKRDTLHELSLAATCVIDGGKYVSGSIMSSLGGATVMLDANDGKQLTYREADVLRLLAAGHTVTEIARLLNRSVKTISGHKADLMQKLGASSDLDLYKLIHNIP